MIDNFKAFQLTTDEAQNVIGQGRGRRGGPSFLKDLTEEQRTEIKDAITGLKSDPGWADLSREDKRAAKKAIFEPYKG